MNAPLLALQVQPPTKAMVESLVAGGAGPVVAGDEQLADAETGGAVAAEQATLAQPCSPTGARQAEHQTDDQSMVASLARVCTSPNLARCTPPYGHMGDLH
jgi:hypothetical protein